MKNISIGQLVISKSGRDKGEYMIVYDIQDDFVFVVDGRKRKLENPKKKSLKHIQLTKHVDKKFSSKIKSALKLTNSDIRKIIIDYHGGGNFGKE